MSTLAISSHGTHAPRLGTRSTLVMLASLLTLGGCYEGISDDAAEGFGEADDHDDDMDHDGELDVEPLGPTSTIWCEPTMHVFPVAAPHNIGYDHASCGTGTCVTSCPDQNANSDWGGAHHGIDVFAHNRAPMVAVTDGVIERVGVAINSQGVPSTTSGIRVRLRDDCGWEYYYGHLDEAVVVQGQHVEAGQLLGYMGKTGTQSVHLHFNISPNGDYKNDINPFPLLRDTSPTACGGELPPLPPPAGDDAQPPPPEGCGTMVGGDALFVDGMLGSCDGRFTLVMQNDGNAVLYQNGGGPQWSSGTSGKPGHVLTMQTDGNLVLYDAGSTPLWNSGTHGHPGSVLRVQDDGNMVIYSGSTPLWWTNQ